MFNELFFFTGFFFLIGSCLGSFANVLICRMPNGESIMGRSHCGSCKKIIPWYQNIPIFAFIFLKGKCSSCKVRYSARYPVVELLTAVLFAVVFYQYQFSWLSLEYFILVFGLVVGSFIDLDHMILPDEITLGGLCLAIVGALFNPERLFLDGLLGLLVGGGSLWLVAYIYYLFTGREGLGGGDIKLLAWIGCLLGWKAIPFVILTSSILGSVIGILVSAKSKDKLKTMIPFGPFISIAAVLYILGLKSVGILYLQLFFPDIQ